MKKLCTKLDCSNRGAPIHAAHNNILPKGEFGMITKARFFNLCHFGVEILGDEMINDPRRWPQGSLERARLLMGKSPKIEPEVVKQAGD